MQERQTDMHRETDMHRARELVEEMQQAQFCNLVTINALVKGYIAVGDMSAATGIPHVMQQVNKRLPDERLILFLGRHKSYLGRCAEEADEELISCCAHQVG